MNWKRAGFVLAGGCVLKVLLEAPVYSLLVVVVCIAAAAWPAKEEWNVKMV